MPTPDIIVKFHESFPYPIYAIKSFGTEDYQYLDERLEAFILQALTDREAEIVAGIEEMKKEELGQFSEDDTLIRLNKNTRIEGYNAALDDIATLITKGEI